MVHAKFGYGIISILIASLAVAQALSPGRIAQLSAGSTSGQFYINSELGLRYQIPGGWTAGEKEVVASHKFAWVDDPSTKEQRASANQCSKNLLLVTKHPEGMALNGFDPMALMIAIDAACFPEITFPKSKTDKDAIQRFASQILAHLQNPGDAVRAPARVRAFENGGRVMIEVSRPLQITTHEIALGPRTMIRNVDRSVLIVPAAGYWVAWIFVSGDDVDMDYLKASKIVF